MEGSLLYGVTPEMVADAARAMQPKILYPYHYGDTDASVLMQLIDTARTEVRIRDLK